MQKPRIGALFSDSKAFVIENKSYAMDYLRPLLPGIIVCEAISQIGGSHFKWLALLAIVTAYLYACFALAWHRAVLLGPKAEHAVNPFALKKGEGRFILAFFGISMIPALFALVAAIPLAISTSMHASFLTAIFACLLIAGVIYAVIISLRYVFILPARSVNVNIPLSEAKQISRGLILTLLSAGMLWFFLAGVAIALWTFVTAFIIHGIIGLPPGSMAGATAMFIFSGLPAIFVNVAIMAMNVTILSRLYQWSVQNRPLNAAPGNTVNAV